MKFPELKLILARIYKEYVKKHLRSLEIARENNLACIHLVDSGGANLQEQTGIFADKDGFGRIFYEMAVMSSQGIPAVVAIVSTNFRNCCKLFKQNWME